MNSFFSLEGPLISFLDKCGRVVLLTVLWIICCIPIITICSSSASFYYAIVKTIRHERSSPAQEFFRCFKRVFKKTILISLACVIISIVLVTDIIVWYDKSSKSSLLNMNLCIVMLLIFIASLCYYFAALSRFLYSQKELIRFSAFLTFKHLPVTMLFLLIVSLMLMVIVVFPISAVFMPGLACMGISYFMENVFKKYIPKPDEGEEVWYDE